MNNMTANNNHNKDREMSLCMVNEPTATHGLRYHRPENKCPIPPHERKNMIYLEFDNNSESKLCKLFGSEEEAEIAIKFFTMHHQNSRLSRFSFLNDRNKCKS